MALDALHTQLLQPPTKVGVVGSGCSLATEPTAQISHYYNVTQVQSSFVVRLVQKVFVVYDVDKKHVGGSGTYELITLSTTADTIIVYNSSPLNLQLSCVSSSAVLSNRTRFRNYFQLLTTDADLAYGFFSIVMKYNWRRVAILLQEDNLFRVVCRSRFALYDRLVVEARSAYLCVVNCSLYILMVM